MRSSVWKTLEAAVWLTLPAKADNVLILPTSRAFGSSLCKPYLIVEAEVLTVKRKARDEFLILATDGVRDYVTPAAVCGFVEQKLRRSRITMSWEVPVDGRGSPTILAKELAEHAVRAGSQDNVSVAVILFKSFCDEPRRPSRNF